MDIIYPRASIHATFHINMHLLKLYFYTMGPYLHVVSFP
jgi:hypothetical protein